MKIFHFDRLEPLKLFDDLSTFEGQASSVSYKAECLKNEEFIFPLALLTDRDGEEIEVKTSLIFGGKAMAGRATSFVTEGVDKFGQAFTKKISLKATEYQPLYIGVDTTGITGKASVLVTIEGDKIYAVEIKLMISEQSAELMGDTEPSCLSRLRWLNTQTAVNTLAAKRYTAVKIEGETLAVLGRQITLSKEGFPIAAQSYFEKNITISSSVQAEYLSNAIRFHAEGEALLPSGLEIKKDGDNARIEAQLTGEKLSACVEGLARYEGSFVYSVRIVAKEDYEGELSLTVPMHADASKYNNGLGLPGGHFRDVSFRWNKSHQDCLFVGAENAGIRIKWLAENYVRPLVNVYYNAQPLVVPNSTWANNDKGSVEAKTEGGAATIVARTGTYSLKKGETRTFVFELHFTPFEPLDKEKMFGVRYYHKNLGCNPIVNIEKTVKRAKKHGLNYIIIHHGNEIHPYINYPFIETESMKKMISLAHAEGIKVKFYYTLRESSNHMAEVFCYKAMGDEIILRKKFDGYGWMAQKGGDLLKYFGEDIVSAWRVPFRRGKLKGQDDQAFIARPNSRLDNYYIEGLKFLKDYFKIDGIYIDDTSLDRAVLERARKVLDENDGLIDMHMWNHEEERAGNASCVNLYTEIFPFIDSLWIGEGFDVQKLPEDYIMTEVAGLPYGKPSQMLQNGGNHYCGMLYGMNNRYGWGVFNADRIYKLWDDFNIKEAVMRGYWDEKNPFSATEPSVKVTAYIKGDEVLVALYNFSKTVVRFELNGAEKFTAKTPAVKGLQRAKSVDLHSLKLKPRDGLFILLKKV